MVDSLHLNRPGLEINHLVIRRRSRDVLTIPALRFSNGQSVAIVGPNGAGKSTLLQALAGLLPLTTGNILLDSRPISDFPARELAVRRAYLTQHFSLSVSFMVDEVVALGRSPHQSQRVVDKQVIDEAIGAVGLGHMVHRPYPSLSGGEQQRVQLARVLAQLNWGQKQEDQISVSRWLFLDEPTASLDLGRRVDVLNVINALKQSGVGVLAVIHDLNLAWRYFDRVVLLHEGRLVAEGNPQQVLDRPLLESVYATPLALVPDGRGGQMIVEA
jgi:iron complex transport system ATP-binding protein